MVDHCTSTLSFLCDTCSNSILLPTGPTATPLRCTSCGHTYYWSDGVLMLGRAGDANDYPDEVYGLLAEIEPKHFWFSGRNDLIVSIMRRAIGPLAGRSALDIGCGTGFVLAALERAGMIGCGLDMHLAGLHYARKRTQGALLCQAATHIPFTAQFDVVMLCDVIEHTSDDSAVLREASRALKDRGAVVVTVPADPHLWTTLDEISGHKRRYTRQMLAQAMRRAGLRVCLMRYFNILLFPVQTLQRRLLKQRTITTGADRLQLFRQSLHVPPSPINTLFRLAMAADIPLSRLPLPFGASLIAVGERM